MKLLFTTLAALVAPLVAQSITTPPTATSTDDWGNQGPPWASSDPAKWSSIYNSLLSAGQIPSTLTAAPWPTGTWGPGQGPWGPGHGPGGRGGHWGSSNYGPWSDWSTRTDWRSGPWTAWWDGSACPASDWPGWTAGPWSTNAPWTTWAGCSAATTATSVVTSTVNGSAVVTTAFGLQVAAASAGGAESTGGGAPMVTAGVGMAVGAAVLGLAVGL